MSSTLKESFIIQNRTKFPLRTGRAKSASLAIDSLLELPEGWHYGEGRGATDEAAKAAKAVDALLLTTDARAIEVFPDVSGGIMVSSRYGNEGIEIDCYPDGLLMGLYHEINDEPVYEQENISLEDVRTYIGGLQWVSRLFDFYIQCTTARKRGDSRARRFRMLQTAAEYPLSSLIAPKRGVARNVGMYILATTPKHQATPPSSGGLTLGNYLMDASPNRHRLKEIHAT